MFQIGDYIVYGHSGVCEVTSVDYPSMEFIDGDNKLYYKLSPVFSTEVIYTPVDTKVYMRPVVTRERAKQLLVQITGETKIPGSSKSKTPDEYVELLKTQQCEDLISILKMIYYKKHTCTQNGKKITTTDQRYLKQAEELLCNELSVVTGNDLDTTKSIIDNALSEWVLKACS